MKNQFLLCFLIFICFTTLLFPQSGKAKSLKLGNKWVYNYYSEYDYDGTYETEEVIKDTTINDKTYAVVFNPQSYLKYSYERADSIKIYEYNIVNSSEYVQQNFSLRDSISDDYEIMVDTLYYWNSTRISICIYSYGAITSSDKCWIEGIGLTYTSYEGHGEDLYTSLVAAFLDGEKYGDTTLVGVFSNKNIEIVEYQLGQNFPNPFNPTTTIKYSIPREGIVKLQVFNLLGERIETLVNGHKGAGNYEVKFNANNLTSGVYFYRINVGNFISTRKMFLLK